jgi:hypothetical protein
VRILCVCFAPSTIHPLHSAPRFLSCSLAHSLIQGKEERMEKERTIYECFRRRRCCCYCCFSADFNHFLLNLFFLLHCRCCCSLSLDEHDLKNSEREKTRKRRKNRRKALSFCVYGACCMRKWNSAAATAPLSSSPDSLNTKNFLISLSPAYSLCVVCFY